jgi:hypothetical protein
MERGPHEIRKWHTFRGHVICVYAIDPDQWGVAVDGMELAPPFSSSYDAWAAGAAESYRRGPACAPVSKRRECEAEERSVGTGTLSAFFLDDHVGLWALLRHEVARPGQLDRAAFGVFRAELLRHIANEERVFAAIRRIRQREVQLLVRRLDIEHRAIVSLLGSPPTPELVAEIVSILEPHKQAEEEGLYSICDGLLGGDAAQLLSAFETYPPIAASPYEDGPQPCLRAEDALAAAARSPRWD